MAPIFKLSERVLMVSKMLHLSQVQILKVQVTMSTIWHKKHEKKKNTADIKILILADEEYELEHP